MTIIVDWKFVAALGIVILAIKADNETVSRAINALGDYAIANSNR